MIFCSNSSLLINEISLFICLFFISLWYHKYTHLSMKTQWFQRFYALLKSPCSLSFTYRWKGIFSGYIPYQDRKAAASDHETLSWFFHLSHRKDPGSGKHSAQGTCSIRQIRFHPISVLWFCLSFCSWREKEPSRTDPYDMSLPPVRSRHFAVCIV